MMWWSLTMVNLCRAWPWYILNRPHAGKDLEAVHERILAATARTCHRNEKIAEAVKSGADPIDASCAMEALTSGSCNNYIMRKNSPVSK